MIENINGYSLALFSLAKEEKKLQEYKKQSLEIINAFYKCDEYILFMENTFIEINLKKELLKKAFSNKINKNLLNFLLLVVDNKKFKISKHVLKKLIKLINQKLNIREGIIYSSVLLSSKQIEKIKEQIEKKIKLQICIENKIDNSILSGFKVEVDDIVIEDTISSRLNCIKNNLLGKDN